MTALEIASYLLRHCKEGRSEWAVKLGTRGIDSLRPEGAPLDLVVPPAHDEISHDGQHNVFLRASDGGR